MRAGYRRGAPMDGTVRSAARMPLSALHAERTPFRFRSGAIVWNLGQHFPRGRYGTPRRRRQEARKCEPANTDTGKPNNCASSEVKRGPFCVSCLARRRSAATYAKRLVPTVGADRWEVSVGESSRELRKLLATLQGNPFKVLSRLSTRLPECHCC